MGSSQRMHAGNWCGESDIGIGGAAWGLIDGFVVVYGGLADTANQDPLISRLKKDRTNRELRDELLDSLGDSAAAHLSDDEKEKLVDRIIDDAPEPKKRYRWSVEDRNTLIAIASCDILAVIPVILPYLFFGFGQPAVAISRLIACIAMGYIAYQIASHIGGRKWLAGAFFVVLTFVVMAVTYYFGW